MLRFSSTVKFDPKVHDYLDHAFGSARLQNISEALARPALHTCLRVNTLRTTPQAVVQQLQQLFPSSRPYTHPKVDTAVILPGRGPLPLNLDTARGREVVVNRYAGEAVLQGANVYAPGLLAASSGLAAGDLVAVTVAVEQQAGGWCGVNRGMRLTPQLQEQLPDREQLCVGLGRVTAGRRELFKQQQGLAIEMVERVYDVTPCNGVLPGEVLLQSLPCVVAAQALNSQPGSQVLDMCAAPGGKTSTLAQMMAGNSSSRLLALDRTAAKAARIRQLVDSWGVGDVVQVMAADATQLYQQEAVGRQGQQQAGNVTVDQGKLSEQAGMDSRDTSFFDTTTATTSSSSSSSSSSRRKRRKASDQDQQQPCAELLAVAQPESFDAVLLDAPCSALGLRPRLLMDWRLPQLESLAGYQRALLHAAVHVLRPGGSLVYCTCTINPGENESNVRYVLDKWPQMQLVEQPLVLGGPGLIGPGWLTATEAQLVQRFDPAAGLEGGADDTIGFFIAKFVKHRSSL